MGSYQNWSKWFRPRFRPVAPILNNDRLYIMGLGEYLEPGLFILDPWGFVMYNFRL
jgi:hypothetical protein